MRPDINLGDIQLPSLPELPSLSGEASLKPVVPVPDKLPMGFPLEERLLNVPPGLEHVRFGNLNPNDPNDVPQIMEIVSKQVGQTPRILEQLRIGNPPVEAVRRGLAPSFGTPFATNLVANRVREELTFVKMLELSKKGQVTDADLDDLGEMILGRKPSDEERRRLRMNLQDGISELSEGAKLDMALRLERAELPMIYRFYRGLLSTYDGRELSATERQALEQAKNELSQLKKEIRGTRKVPIDWLRQRAEKWSIIKNLLGLEAGEPFVPALNTASLMNYLQRIENGLNSILNRSGTQANAAAQLLSILPGPFGNKIAGTIPVGIENEEVGKVAYSYFRMLPFFQEVLKRPDDPLGRIFLVRLPDGRYRVPTLSEYYRAILQNRHLLAQNMLKAIAPLREVVQQARNVFESLGSGSWAQSLLGGRNANEIFNRIENLLDTLEREPSNERAFVELYRYLEPLLRGAEQKLGRTSFVSRILAPFGIGLEIARNLYDRLASKLGFQPSGDIIGRGSTAPLMNILGQSLPKELAEKINRYFGQATFYASLLHQVQPLYPNPADRIIALSGHSLGDPRGVGKFARMMLPPMMAWELARTVLSPHRGVLPLTDVGAAADTAMIGLTGEVNRLFKDWWRRLGLWYKEPVEAPMGTYPVPELHQQAFGHSFPMMMAFSMNPTELAGQVVLGAATMGIGPVVAGAARVGTMIGRLGTALARPLAGRFGLRLASRVSPLSAKLAQKLAVGEIAYRMAALGRGARIGSSLLLKELGLVGDWGDVDEIVHYTLQQEGMPQALSQRLLYLLSDPNVWMTSMGQGISFQPFTQPYHGVRTIIRGLRRHQPQLDLSSEYDVVLEPRWSLEQVQLHYTPSGDVDVSQLQPVAQLPEERETGYVGIRNRTGQLIWYPIVGVSVPAENQVRVQVRNEQNELVELDPSDMNLLVVPKEPVANSGHYLPFLIGRSFATNNRGAPREYWAAQLGTLNTNALIESGFLQPTQTGEFQLDPELYQELRNQLMQPTLNTLDYALAYYDTIRELMESDPSQIGQVEVVREHYENAVESLRSLAQLHPRWLVLNRYDRLMEFLENEEEQSAAMVLDALIDKVLHDAPEIGLQVYEDGEYQPTHESVYALPIRVLNRFGVGGQSLLKLMTLIPSLNLYRNQQGEFYLGLSGQDAQWLRQSGLLEQVRQQLMDGYRGFYEPDQGYPIYTVAGLLNDLRVLLGLDTRLRQVPVLDRSEAVSGQVPAAEAGLSEESDAFQRWLVSQPVEELFQPDFEVVSGEEARRVLEPQQFEVEVREVQPTSTVSRVDWRSIREGITQLIGFEPSDLFGLVHAFRSVLSSLDVSFQRDIEHVVRYSDGRSVLESLKHYLGRRVQRLVERGAISDDRASQLSSFIEATVDELYRMRVVPVHPVVVGATPVSFQIRSELQQRWRDRVQRLDLRRDYRLVASLFEAVRLVLEDGVPSTLQEMVRYFESFTDRFQTYDDFVRYWDSDEVRALRERYRVEWEQHGNRFLQDLRARGIDSPSIYAFFELVDPYNDLAGFVDFVHVILPSSLMDAVLLANQEGIDRAFRNRLYEAWMAGLRERLGPDSEWIESVVAPIQWLHASYFAQERYLSTVRDRDVYQRLLVDAVLGEQPVSVAGTELAGQPLGELIVRFAEPEIYAYTMAYEGREPYIFVSSQLVGRYPSLAVYTLYEELWHGLVYRLRAELERADSLADADRRGLSQALEVLLADIGSRLLGRNMQVVLDELTRRVLKRYDGMGLDLSSLREIVSAAQEEQAVREGLIEVLTELLERSERTGLTEPERLFILDAFRYWLVRELGLTTDEILGLPSYQLYGFFLEFIKSHTSERLGLGRGSFGLERVALGSFPFRLGSVVSRRYPPLQLEEFKKSFASALGAKVPITGRYQHGVLPVAYDTIRVQGTGQEVVQILSDYFRDFPNISHLLDQVRQYVRKEIVLDDQFDVFGHGYWKVSHQGGDQVILEHRLSPSEDSVKYILYSRPSVGVSEQISVIVPDREAYRFQLLSGVYGREPLAILDLPSYTIPSSILPLSPKQIGTIDANNQLSYDVGAIEARVQDWVRWFLPAALVSSSSWRLVQRAVHYPDRRIGVPSYVLDQEVADWVRYGITTNLGVDNRILVDVINDIKSDNISYVRYQVYVPLPPEYGFDSHIGDILVITRWDSGRQSAKTWFYLISSVLDRHIVLLEELDERIQAGNVLVRSVVLAQPVDVLKRIYDYLSSLGIREVHPVYNSEPYLGDLSPRIVLVGGVPAISLDPDRLYYYLLSSSPSDYGLPLGHQGSILQFIQAIYNNLNINLADFTVSQVDIERTPLVSPPQGVVIDTVYSRSDLENYRPVGMGVYVSGQRYRIYYPEWEQKWELLAQLFTSYLQGRIWGVNRVIPVILSDKWVIDVQGQRLTVLDYLQQLVSYPNLSSSFSQVDPFIFEGLDRLVDSYRFGRYENEADILIDRLRRLMTEDERWWRNSQLLSLLRHVSGLSDIAHLSDDDLSQLLDIVLSDREFWRGYLAVVNQVNLVGRGWIDVKRVQVPVSVMFKEIYDRLYTIGEVRKNNQPLWDAEVYLGVQLGRVRVDETVLIYQETEEATLNYHIVLVIPEGDGERVIVRSLDEDEVRAFFFAGEFRIQEGSDIYTVRSDLSLSGLLRYAILRMRLYAVRVPENVEVIEIPQGVPLGLPVHVKSGSPRLIELGEVLNEYGWHRLFRWFRNVLNSYYERRKTHRLDEAKRRAYLQFLQSVAGYLIRFGLSDRPQLVSYLDRLGLYAHEPNYRIMHMMLGRVLGSGAYDPESRIAQLTHFYRLLNYLANASNDDEIEVILDLLHSLEDIDHDSAPLRVWGSDSSLFMREYSVQDREVGDPDRNFWVRQVYDIMDVFTDEWLDHIWRHIPVEVLQDEGLGYDSLEQAKRLSDLKLTYNVFRVINDFIQSIDFDVITILKDFSGDDVRDLALRRFHVFHYFVQMIASSGNNPNFWFRLLWRREMKSRRLREFEYEDYSYSPIQNLLVARLLAEILLRSHSDPASFKTIRKDLIRILLSDLDQDKANKLFEFIKNFRKKKPRKDSLRRILDAFAYLLAYKLPKQDKKFILSLFSNLNYSQIVKINNILIDLLSKDLSSIERINKIDEMVNILAVDLGDIERDMLRKRLREVFSMDDIATAINVLTYKLPYVGKRKAVPAASVPSIQDILQNILGLIRNSFVVLPQVMNKYIYLADQVQWKNKTKVPISTVQEKAVSKAATAIAGGLRFQITPLLNDIHVILSRAYEDYVGKHQQVDYTDFLIGLLDAWNQDHVLVIEEGFTRAWWQISRKEQYPTLNMLVSNIKAQRSGYNQVVGTQIKNDGLHLRVRDELLQALRQFNSFMGDNLSPQDAAYWLGQVILGGLYADGVLDDIHDILISSSSFTVPNKQTSVIERQFAQWQTQLIGVGLYPHLLERINPNIVFSMLDESFIENIISTLVFGNWTDMSDSTYHDVRKYINELVMATQKAIFAQRASALDYAKGDIINFSRLNKIIKSPRFETLWNALNLQFSYISSMINQQKIKNDIGAFAYIINELILATEFISLLYKNGVLRLNNDQQTLLDQIKQNLISVKDQIVDAVRKGTAPISDYQTWTTIFVQVVNWLDDITRPLGQPATPLNLQFTSPSDVAIRIHNFYSQTVHSRLVDMIHPLVGAFKQALSARFITDQNEKDKRRTAIQTAFIAVNWQNPDINKMADESFRLLITLLRLRRYDFPHWNRIRNLLDTDLQQLKDELKELYNEYTSLLSKAGISNIPQYNDKHFEYVAALLRTFLSQTGNQSFNVIFDPTANHFINKIFGVPIETNPLPFADSAKAGNYQDDQNVIEQVISKRNGFYPTESVFKPEFNQFINQIIEWFTNGEPSDYEQIASTLDNLVSLGSRREVSLILSALQGATNILNLNPSSLRNLMIQFDIIQSIFPDLSLPIWSQLIMDLSHFIRDNNLFQNYLSLSVFPFHLHPYREPFNPLTPYFTQRELKLYSILSSLPTESIKIELTNKIINLIRNNATDDVIEREAISEIENVLKIIDPHLYTDDIIKDMSEYIYSLYIHPYLNKLRSKPERIDGIELTILYHIIHGEIKHIARIYKSIKKLISLPTPHEQLFQILLRFSLPFIAPDIPITFTTHITPQQLPQYQALRANYIYVKQNLLNSINQLKQRLEEFYKRDRNISLILRSQNYQPSELANQVAFALTLMIGSRISETELNPTTTALENLIREMRNLIGKIQRADRLVFQNVNFSLSHNYIQDLITTILKATPSQQDNDIIELVFNLIMEIHKTTNRTTVSIRQTQNVGTLSGKLARFRPWIRPEMFDLLYRLAITSNQARDTLEEQFSAEQAIYSWIRHLLQLALPSSGMLPPTFTIPQTLAPAQQDIKPLDIVLALREKQKLNALQRRRTETIPYYLAPLPITKAFIKPTEEIRSILEIIHMLEPIYNSFGRIPQPSPYVFYANEGVITLMLLLNMAGFVPVITRYHTVGSIIFDPRRARENIRRLEKFILQQFIPSYALDVPVPQPTQELENAIRNKFKRLRKLQKAFIKANIAAPLIESSPRGVENFIRTAATLLNPEQIVIALLSNEGTELIQNFAQFLQGKQHQIVNEVINLVQMITSGATARRTSQFGTLAYLLSAIPETPGTNQSFIFPTIRTTLSYQKIPIEAGSNQIIDEIYKITIKTYKDQHRTSKIDIRIRRNDIIIMLIDKLRMKSTKILKELLEGKMITKQKALDQYMSNEFITLLSILEHAVPDKQKKLIIDFRQYLSIAKEKGFQSPEAKAYRTKFQANKDYMQIFHILKNKRILKQKIALALIKNPSLSTLLPSIITKEFDIEKVPIEITIELSSKGGQQQQQQQKQKITKIYPSIGKIPLSIRRFAGILDIAETIRDIIQYIRDGNDFNQYSRVFFVQPTPVEEISEPSIQAQRSLEETIQYSGEEEGETTLGEIIPDTGKTIEQATTTQPKSQISIKIPQESTSQTITTQQGTTLNDSTIYQTILTDALRYIINIPSISTTQRDQYEPIIYRKIINKLTTNKLVADMRFEELIYLLFASGKEQERKLLVNRFTQIVKMHPYTIKLITERNMPLEEIIKNVMKEGKGKHVRITMYSMFIPTIIRKLPTSTRIVQGFDIELLTPEPPTPPIEETTYQPSPSGGTGGQTTTQAQTRQHHTTKIPTSQHLYRRIGGTTDFFIP